jgi:hypothetical protein
MASSLPSLKQQWRRNVITERDTSAVKLGLEFDDVISALERVEQDLYNSLLDMRDGADNTQALAEMRQFTNWLDRAVRDLNSAIDDLDDLRGEVEFLLDDDDGAEDSGRTELHVKAVGVIQVSA